MQSEGCVRYLQIRFRGGEDSLTGEMGYPRQMFILQADILFGFVHKSCGLTKLYFRRFQS